MLYVTKARSFFAKINPAFEFTNLNKEKIKGLHWSSQNRPPIGKREEATVVRHECQAGGGWGRKSDMPPNNS